MVLTRAVLGAQQSFPAFSCCMEPQEVRNDWKFLSPLSRVWGKNALRLVLPDSAVPFCPPDTRKG